MSASEAAALEESHGFGAVDAFVSAQLQHVVFSTTGSTAPHVIPHFDSKTRIADRLKASGLPTTILLSSYYYSNVKWFLPSDAEDDKTKPITIACPMPDDVVLPSYAVEQTGSWAAAAFRDPGRWVGKDMEAAGENMTVKQVADQLAEVTGREVRTLGMTHEQFRNDKEMDREWYANFDAMFKKLISRDVEESKKIVPDAWDFRAWAKQDPRIAKLIK